jgi:hypothetical protein
VAVALDDARATAFGPGPVAPESGRFVDLDRRDLQFINVGTVIVFRVGDRRLEHFLYDARALLR